jgi:hypothetical protein
MKGHDLTIRLEQDGVREDFQLTTQELRGMLQDLVDTLLRNVHPEDRVRFTLQHPRLNNQIFVPFLLARELTVEKIMSEIEKVLQSNENFTIDLNISIHFVHVEMPRGGGWRELPPIPRADQLKKMGTVISIDNSE